MSANITVVNESNEIAHVAINEWGTGGSTGYWKLQSTGNSKKWEHWDRTDSRGFVMHIKETNGFVDGSYFVKSNVGRKYIIYKDHVTDEKGIVLIKH